MAHQLPSDARLTRTTPVFDRRSVPAGLLRAHHVASGVWARLIVESGTVGFVFEDEADEIAYLGPGDDFVIPPQRPHHVEPGGDARFRIEFYR